MTADPDATLPWQAPGWRSEVDAWVRAALARHHLVVAGEVEQPHVQWWSTVLRVPTDGGTVWFKAMQAGGAFEARLTPMIAAGWPRATAEILATDPDQGWMLARDAGTRLRDLDDGTPAVDHWERLLPRHAELQLSLVTRTGELAAAGVPDLGLAVLPAELRAALEEPDVLLLGRDGGLSADEHRRLHAGSDDFAGICARLAGCGIPASLQHDDLHDGNAFLRDGEYVFFDWGDACLSHPFHTLVVTLRALCYARKWEPGGPEVQRLLAAYLEPWQALADAAQISEAAGLARRTGTVQRSMAWRRGVADMPEPWRSENVDSVPYGLRLYLLDGPWGSWDDGTF